MARSDSAFNADGSWNEEAYRADLARTPRKEEVGVESVWEIDDNVKFPGVWKVTKINPSMLQLVNETGDRLKAPVSALRRTDKPFVVKENVFKPHAGTVVTPVRDLGPRAPKAGTAYVVLKTVGFEDVQLAVLNGDGKYWPRIPINLLQPFTGTINL